MKKTDIHTFIKKYNSELSIKGYSKMKKADLVRVVESTLKRSRQEIKDEWSSMKQGSFATKSGAKRSNTATKTGLRQFSRVGYLGFLEGSDSVKPHPPTHCFLGQSGRAEGVREERTPPTTPYDY